MTTKDLILADDILRGAEEIGVFTGIKPRKIYHLASTGQIPHFRMGSLICARKSTLLKSIEAQEKGEAT